MRRQEGVLATYPSPPPPPPRDRPGPGKVPRSWRHYLPLSSAESQHRSSPWSMMGPGCQGRGFCSPVLYLPATDPQDSWSNSVLHPNQLFLAHKGCVSPSFFHHPRHSIQHLNWQTSIRDLDFSVGGKGGSLLLFTRYLTCAKAAQLLSLNPLGPCKVAS